MTQFYNGPYRVEIPPYGLGKPIKMRLFRSRLTVSGKGADRLGRLGLQRIAQEARLPVLVRSGGKHHAKGDTYLPRKEPRHAD